MRASFAAWMGSFAERRRLRTAQELTSVLGRCQQLMEKGDCDAEAFERAAVMLHQTARYQEEIAICSYVRQWVDWRERQFIFGERMWLNAGYKRILARQARAQVLLTKQG